MKPPPLLVSFSTEKQFLDALGPANCDLFGRVALRLVADGLPPAVSARCLATLFGYSPAFVGAMAHVPERYYRTFTIPKGRGMRVIHAPRVALKAIQCWFGFHLSRNRVAQPMSCVYGFVPGRSAIQAATAHCGADWVLSLDIEEFFPSTGKLLVVEALEQIGYPRHGAELMAGLCCLRGALPQGSPASPALSNLIFQATDESLSRLGVSHRVTYTRYADDMVFSGNGEPPADLQTLAEGLVRAAGWKISERKTRLVARPGRLKVHGLLIDGDQPRLSKGYRNRVRAFRHMLDAGKVREEDVPRLRGHLAYATSVENSKSDGILSSSANQE